MYRPSADQSSSSLLLGVFRSNPSSPVPPELFWYKLKTPPSRFDTKAIRVPSSDQTGSLSVAGSKVKRVLLPRSRSVTQISPPPSGLNTARRLPSGDSLGFSYRAGVPILPSA